MPLPSAHYTCSRHTVIPDHTRHSIRTQASQPLLPSLYLLQHSSIELGILASKFPPFLSSKGHTAAASSYLSITQEGYGSWSASAVTSDPSSKPKTGLYASTFQVKDAVSSSDEEDKESAASSQKDVRTDAYPSERKKAFNASIEEEVSFDNGLSSLNDFKRLPINLDLSLYRAKCMFRNREFNEGEKILRQCIKDWPTDGRAYVALGTRLVKIGRFVDARKVYEDGCQAARGENPYIWQAWAMLEHKLGHVSQARKLFDASTAADIRHGAAWHGWAVLELQQGNTRKARELLSKGLRFCGGNEYLYQTSALIEYRAGKVEEARVFFSQAVSCNPRSCASWLAWALLEAENGNVSTARYLFQRGVRASPRNRYAWQAWALFECSQSKKDWARKLFEQGIELNPYDAIILQAFALFEYDSSNPERARELFKLAASKDSKHQPIWNAWGWMEYKEKNIELARQYFRKSLSINSRTAEAARTYHAWAKMEGEVGNYGSARELFKYALRVDPQNTPSWRSWARMEEEIGNDIRAEEIRLQFLQQRIEVVDEGWDVSFSSMFAPAIDRIKSFFKIQIPSVEEDVESSAGIMPEILEVVYRRKLDMDKIKCDEDFDLDAFIMEVVPGKYMPDTRFVKDRLKTLKAFTALSCEKFEAFRKALGLLRFVD
ncbi:hypothetical protein GOP47_0002524 [Adiantum capillus-veneris]|uniref:Uncharacterized protein n=1 Tax=Adiantum capillus-veneris TaxID=13818 RepID=A0A9D4ZR14_ADICA|nr:hypothetical protein GOP47_0002524 [Adiantum capillus-veneris]